MPNITEKLPVQKLWSVFELIHLTDSGVLKRQRYSYQLGNFSII